MTKKAIFALMSVAASLTLAGCDTAPPSTVEVTPVQSSSSEAEVAHTDSVEIPASRIIDPSMDGDTKLIYVKMDDGSLIRCINTQKMMNRVLTETLSCDWDHPLHQK